MSADAKPRASRCLPLDKQGANDAAAKRRCLEQARRAAADLASQESRLPLHAVPVPLTSWSAWPWWLRANLKLQPIDSDGTTGSSSCSHVGTSEPSRTVAYMQQYLALRKPAAFRGADSVIAQRAPSRLQASHQELMQVFLSARLPRPRDVGDFIGEDQSNGSRYPHGAPPRANLQALARAQQLGLRPTQVADVFVGARLLASMRQSTIDSYTSALRLSYLFCCLIGCALVPTTKSSIWRFAALLSNELSLRVYLAAWRKAHILSGFMWPCEACIVLRDIRKGVRNSMGMRGPRPCIRARRWLALVRYAVLQGAWKRAARYVFAYQFLLRVPSELLRQFRPRLLTIEPSSKSVRFGPLQRKTSTGEVLVAPCICNTGGRLVCAHVWAEWVVSVVAADCPSLFLTCGYEEFVQGLRGDLASVGVPTVEAQTVASHAFRHGAARDLLAETGLANTMSRGGWKGKGVFHYTPKAEVESQAMAEVWENLSDDET